MATAAQTWLTGDRDYTDGLDILKDNDHSPFLIKLLSAGPDSFNTPKLLAAIEAIAAASPEPDPKNISPDAHQPEPGNLQPASPDNNLEKKLRIDGMIRQLWKEITHLHGQLGVLPEGERLHEVAKAIITKNLKRQDLWDQLNYYNTNGKWFDDLPENQPKPENIEQEIKNARSNRSKAKSNLTKPLPAAVKAHYEKMVSDWNARIDQLTKMRDAR